jgi:tetratricopeptide (TPR) repeat protein
MNENIILEKTKKIIESKSFILFCGAGISFNSNIPTVKPLVTNILENLHAEENHIHTYNDSKYPFEGLIEILNERLGISKLLDVFNIENPNNNHFLIAYLALKKYLRIIYTTNFDVNIETAFRLVGLKKGRDYLVIGNASRLDKDTLSTDKIILIKLHGSISDKNSLVTTIRSVAAKENTSKIVNFLNDFILQDPSEYILFWGYSFSDHFDIVPALQLLPPLKKEIRILEHNNSTVPPGESINKSDKLSKFQKAYYWNCDTNVLISSLLKHFNFKTTHHQPKNNKWKNIIGDWCNSSISEKGIRTRYGTLIEIFLRSEHFDLAAHYIDLQLNSNSFKNDRIYAVDLLSRAAQCLAYKNQTNDLLKAVEYYDEITNILKGTNDSNNYYGHLGGKGIILYRLGRYTESERYLREALSYYSSFIRTNTIPHVHILKDYSGYLSSLANCLKNQYKTEEAIKYYNQSLEVATLNGFVDIEIMNYYGLGKVFLFENNLPKAIEYFKKSYYRAKSINLPDRAYHGFIATCKFLLEVGVDEAFKFYSDEYSSFESITKRSISFKEISENIRF